VRVPSSRSRSSQDAELPVKAGTVLAIASAHTSFGSRLPQAPSGSTVSALTCSMAKRLETFFSGTAAII